MIFTVVTYACSSFRITTTDKNVFYGRTLEWAVETGEQLFIVPVGTVYNGLLPEGTQGGMRWASKYGVVGVGALGLPLIVDGTNEAGLACGLLNFAGYADYQKYDPANKSRTIMQTEVPTWILTNFATVQEVRNNIGKIFVSQGNDKYAGQMQIHYTVHDKTGDSIVIEYIKGKLTVYDNPIGVMTNQPDFAWHLTNLKNYSSLRPTNAQSITIDGVQEAGFGQGNGMFGLPGDYTPASRFVRLVALTAAAFPVTGADKGLALTMNIINNIDIPAGAVRATVQGQAANDTTWWVIISDLGRGRFYYRNYNDMNWRYIDLKQALAANKKVATIPLYTEGQYTNDTAKAVTVAKPTTNYYSFQNPKNK